MKVLHLQSNKKANSETDMNQIEAKFTGGKQKMNSLKISRKILKQLSETQ